MDRFFPIFHCDFIDELGDSLKISKWSIFLLALFIFSTKLKAIEKLPSLNKKESVRIEYYKYWNPYRRVLDIRGEPQSFYGQIYYRATYNKDNRIKTVTKYGKDRKEKETYFFIWSKSGSRSEYKILFHESGNVSRLDSNLYSNELSNIRSGWVGRFISRSDGRPRKVSFEDSVGFEYFSYNFNYTLLKDDGVFTEVVESSYFNSNNEFVGRHLLYWGKDAYLKMIQYFDSENKIIRMEEYINDIVLGETIRILTNKEGLEIERKIIPYMPPDKYAYKYEWDGKNVIDKGLKELESLDLAMEFYGRAQEALNKANEQLQNAKESLDKANQRAKNAEKLMQKAEGKAKEVESFKSKMDKAKIDAQKAIEEMYNAEREAESARLEAAAATATLEAIRKAKEIETYAKKEAKRERKEAKRERKEARKKAREAKRALQDSLLGTGPQSFLTLSYGQPVLIEKTLENHVAGPNYIFGFGRRNMFQFDGKNIDVGIEVNYFDFTSSIDNQDLQTLSYFIVAQIDPRIAWSWVPSTFETSIKVGGGLVSPGYGFTIGSSGIFNLLPTPIIVGINAQFNWVSGAITKETNTYWSTIGLIVGVNLQDKLSEIFDIDFPSIFDIF